MKNLKIIIKRLLESKIKTPADLASFKRKISKKYKIPCPSNIELLRAYHILVKKGIIQKSEKTENILKTRPIRSLSGIVNVSVLTKPYPCPGKCLYCPQESGIPKSYLSGEPAVERAKTLNYDPFLQVKKRIETLKAGGHPTEKIELRIVGGTWSYYPKKYQTWFIKRCFDAANEKLIRKINTTASIFRQLLSAQKLNEKATHRIVSLSIETRPDFINKREIKHLRKLGVTMVELGVQTIYDDILKLNLREHTAKEIIKATKLLKDAGFKVLYQMMPNLLGSNPNKDLEMFETLFKNPDFQPDYLKIYPCILLKEAPLYKWWIKEKYKPYPEKTLIKLIKEIKKKIPYYVRIQRIARDIPSQRIVAGTKTSNLRQVIHQDMQKEDWKCKCIRCREVRKNYNPKEKIYLFRENYNASAAREVFLSYENKNRTKLYSLLRLRISNLTLKESSPTFSVLTEAAIIREIKTFGEMIPVGTKKPAPQHQGLGKKLIKEAEKITKKEFGLNKIAVIAGIGAREYFKKLGYKLKNTYMVKKFKFF